MNESTPSKFSNTGEIEQIAQYRRFNLLAIFSALLGIASIGLLVSPFLLIVPLLAIFLGVCGLVAYRRRDDLGGRIPSWIGICLALFFISWATAEFSLTRCVYYSEACGIVDDWLNLVLNGEHEIAHQAMMNVAQRQATGLSVDEYYAMDSDARTAMEEIFSEEPMSKLASFGKETNVRLLKNVSLVHDLDNTMIQQVFRLTPSNGEPLDLKVVTVRRYNTSAKTASWMINGAELSEEPRPNIAEKVSCFVTNLMAG